MKILCAATLGLVLLAAGGCATRSTMPDWINGVSHQYPGGQYLIGRGEAATEEEARDRARADLARIFEVSVAAESQDAQTFTQNTNPEMGGKSAGEYRTQTSRRVTTRADQRIEGIQVVDVWQDPRTRTHYALAVLPRLPTSQRLRQEIEHLDAATRKYLEASREATDIFMKIGAAEHALDAQRERAGYQKALGIVDPTGRGAAPEWNADKLSADLDGLLKRVRIAGRVAPGAPEGFAAAVNGALADAGFSVEMGRRPDYILKARLDLTDLGLQGDWYWQHGAMEVTLKGTADGRVRGSRHWDIQVSAQSPEVARRRAFDRAASILSWELRDTLIGFARP
jgi:LPP20 lipoprotein